MRRLALLLALAAGVIFAAAPGFAASGSAHKDAGEESQDVAEAANWFTGQRLAPNGAVDPNAYAAGARQAASLPSVGGAWTERTNLPGAETSVLRYPHCSHGATVETWTIKGGTHVPALGAAFATEVSRFLLSQTKQ